MAAKLAAIVRAAVGVIGHRNAASGAGYRLAALAAGTIQFLILFPLEKYVLLKYILRNLQKCWVILICIVDALLFLKSV